MKKRLGPQMVLMVLGMLALLAGLWTGLARLGWTLPPLRLQAYHGPLLVSGFLGTLIGVERAVALGRRWPYAAPLLTGLGALAVLVGLPKPVGPILMTLGSLGLVAIFILIIRIQRALFTAAMGLAALVWLVGNALWLAGRAPYEVVPWWAGFLVLTIAGERLELGRIMRPSAAAQTAFVLATIVLLLAFVLSVVSFDVGVRLLGAGLVFVALWLARYDVARRNIRQQGLPRFMAASLLVGYVWLAVSGIVAIIFGGVISGPHYDAVLHTLFLGFVFSMIFGHAPIVFPALMGRAIVFQQSFYAHLVLLHLSLILRVVGDLSGWAEGRQWGGVLNVIAILLFLANTVRAVLRSSTKT
ncbi:MAG: hypothetical protein HYX82_05485 [Chloroflexi bacterium]|nr:hypothetical protein [Chloroflexota bacterium]